MSAAGLTEAQALQRLRAEGFNDLPRTDQRTLLRIVGDVLREPMFSLLLGAGAIYLVLGDLTEAVVLLLFATISVSITVVQETRSERVLEALRDMTSPRALVIRDGVRKRIPGREVVRGDAVVLLEGDRIPADAALAVANNLLVDESLLTGESVPVRKSAVDGDDSAPMARPGGEDQPFVFSGTLVVRGDGLAIVRSTGPLSEIGKIGQALEKIAAEPPRLQQQTRRLVRYFAVVGLSGSLIAVLLYGLLRGDWLQAILGGIALGMSMLPEEFPLVLTAFMVMGAWRLSQARILTRRATAIEMLGSATVLCTDKTGTLTENRMTIAKLRTAASSGGQTRLIETALLASGRDSFDPMERAIKAQAETQPGGVESVYADMELIRQYGLRPGLLAMTNVWRLRHEAKMEVCAKGAPETIGALCRLDSERLAWLHGAMSEMAQDGVRVLGVAHAIHPGGDLPETQKGFDYEFVGLLGFVDPIRANVPAAVGECRSAGVRVVMITGDYPATAEAIARRAGLEASGSMSGEELARLDEAALADRIDRVDVFARIMPEQKLRLVEALKAKGEIVAMTGDGVNDAPALKSAHIGIAMGGRGTDVAREASSIVLLDDDFGSIVRTVRLGRRIYDNLRKAMAYIVAVHVPIAGLALLPLLFGLPLVLTPIHIAFLEMVIDPACSIVFEAEPDEDDLMRRPPRSSTSQILPGRLIGWSLVQGVLAFAAVAATFAGGLAREMPENELRALVFVSLVLINTSLIVVNRSFSSSMLTALCRPNLSLWLLLSAVTAILAIGLTWQPAMDLFRFGPLHLDDLGLSLLAGVAVLTILELIKPYWRATFRS
ncbi:MAG: cation-translocating P-type ATPase [Reyranella sp.]|nr:cation-translocating P-type ATPase [Reyranella sp.]